MIIVDIFTGNNTSLHCNNYDVHMSSSNVTSQTLATPVNKQSRTTKIRAPPRKKDPIISRKSKKFDAEKLAQCSSQLFGDIRNDSSVPIEETDDDFGRNFTISYFLLLHIQFPK